MVIENRRGRLFVSGEFVFNPEQIIFAPTSSCNLSCGHCRVRRRSEELSISDAVGFLERCADGGIERVGFSGGEPFLRPDFLEEVSRAAVAKGLYFDRLMTNASWFSGVEELETALSGLYDAGFDGTFGVSSDAYHGQDAQTIALFLNTAFRVWRRRDCAEILSARSGDDSAWLKSIGDVAVRLGGRLVSREGEPVAIEDATPRREDAAAGETLDIQILRFPYSASAAENAWKSSRWFKEDFCEGPGNVFYVHPDGSVAVCCGFANENPELIIGTVHDGYEDLMRKASETPLVRLCYGKGLEARRKELESRGYRFPGRTDDMCFFCDYLCKNELIAD